MINSKDILNYVEGLLNQITVEKDFDIVFDGEVNFYNVEWYREKFGAELTPFCLVTNRFETLDDGISSVSFRYTIVGLPFAEDRERIYETFTTLFNRLGKHKIDGYNVSFRPTNYSYGADMSEGSGRGVRRFEALFEFEGKITSAYNISDLNLSVGELDIPIKSFKLEHGKTNYANIEDDSEYNNQKYTNANMLVVETQLVKNSGALALLGMGQKVNISYDVLLKVDTTTIIDLEMEFKGHTFVGNSDSGDLPVFLYFGVKEVIDEITINGETIPLIDWSFVTATSDRQFNNSTGNRIVSFYTGKITGYAFLIDEDYENEVTSALLDYALGDEETVPAYEVEIKIGAKEYSKTLLLNKLSKEKGRSVLTLEMSESGE